MWILIASFPDLCILLTFNRPDLESAIFEMCMNKISYWVYAVCLLNF